MASGRTGGKPVADTTPAARLDGKPGGNATATDSDGFCHPGGLSLEAPGGKTRPGSSRAEAVLASLRAGPISRLHLSPGEVVWLRASGYLITAMPGPPVTYRVPENREGVDDDGGRHA